MHDTLMAMHSQKRYCENHDLPYFAPEDSRCPQCHSIIYADGGYTVEYASENLVTACPFCHFSFVE